MNNPIPLGETPQSFVIRMWRESPWKWRGTVRHVQSESQRAFERLDQALGFIDERTSAQALKPIQKVDQPAGRPGLGWSWIGARRLQAVWAVAGLAVLLVITLLLVNPNANVPLRGAAVGRGDELQLLTAFVFGALIGGAGVALFFRVKH